jgi:hypothetical protein
MISGRLPLQSEGAKTEKPAPARSPGDEPRPMISPEDGARARRSIGQTIKRQFRVVMQQLTASPPTLPPQPGRRRREDTGRSFRMAARKITPRAARALIIHAGQYLADTLDWLNLWSANDDPASTSEAGDDFQHTGTDYLSLHL